jgi:secreted PhoX family phosphatase
VTVNRFVEGDADFNQPDNLAFQPGTRNIYVIEDNSHGDIWACLPDGADRDIKTDGCVKMLSVVDGSAEPTGFLFSGDGRTAYVSIQHSADPADDSMDVDGYGTDDVLMITGFRPVRQP